MVSDDCYINVVVEPRVCDALVFLKGAPLHVVTPNVLKREIKIEVNFTP
jgi:hypothetical protein